MGFLWRQCSENCLSLKAAIRKSICDCSIADQESLVAGSHRPLDETARHERPVIGIDLCNHHPANSEYWQPLHKNRQNRDHQGTQQNAALVEEMTAAQGGR
jgi:hypothetical protein